jgi:rhamnulokinase
MKLAAVDLGASGGRVLLGTLGGSGNGKLEMEEVHRFPHGPLFVPTDFGQTLYWNVFTLWQEVLVGLRKVSANHGRVDSVGVDTWGDDFALLDRNGSLLGCPVCYRDPRTDGMIALAFERVGQAEIFARTGMQFMTPNSLYHMMGLMAQGSPLLDTSSHFLMMPDLFHYWLCGSKTGEYTNASITQMLNATTRDWDHELLESLGVPSGALPTLNQPGARLGTLRPSVADETGLGADTPVICPATHDTAAAVVATPGSGSDWAFLSAGTWCLFGAEVDRPYLEPSVLQAGFGNEGGVRGTIRLLRNITGLWLVQECRRFWASEGAEPSYAELTREAAEAKPFVALLDPDAPEFAQPSRMPHTIGAYCARQGQSVPANRGEFVRVCLESIALTVRLRWDQLCAILGRQLAVLHIVGGGTQNRLLCQFIANAIDRPVLAGPVEATAIGNALTQLVGHGELDYSGARELVRRSIELEEYVPTDRNAWADAYGRYLGFRSG